jgi:hypothetical protein
MGGFINSQADNEICEVLNKRFSDQVDPTDGRTYIAQLRDHFQNRENFFDGNHRLNRVFHRLAISVTGGKRVPRVKNSRFRWLFLLRQTLPDPVKQAIRGQLTAILTPASSTNLAGATDYVTFSTQHIATTTGEQFELDSRNSPTPAVHNDANGKKYCKITLQCNIDKALADSPNETDPTDPDDGETSFAARRKPAKKSSATKKSSAKKSAGKKYSRNKTATKKRKAKK